jgi:hypothetical protein
MPPCRHKIMEAVTPPVWMSSRTPPPPLSLQDAADSQPFSIPPRPVKGKDSNNKLQRQRRPQTRLLKKASLDTPSVPRSHHESSVKKNADDRLGLRISSRATSLRKMGRTTLLKEMPLLFVIPSHHSCHRSSVATTTRQIRTMGPGDLHQFAKYSISHLKLNLPLNLASFHCLLTPATPARAQRRSGENQAAGAF